MNTSVSITAILCNFNGGNYLQEAIDSVIRQKHLPNEFIIVDDKSTDDSINIIRNAQQRHPNLITLIEHTENKGQAAGMNTAFSASRGQVLAFLDSDDIWFPEKLTALQNEYLTFPNFGLYQHNLQIILQNEITDELYMPAMLQGDVFQLWKRNDTFPNFSPTSGLAVRREVYSKLYPLPEQLTISADSFLTRAAICFGPVASTLAAFGGYRKHLSNNVYGNNKHNAWHFFLDIVSPLLADFYRSHEFPLCAHIKPRSTLLDRILDTSIRAIARDIKHFMSR